MSLSIVVNVSNLVDATRLLEVLSEQGFIGRDMDPPGGAPVAAPNPPAPGPIAPAAVDPSLLSKIRKLKASASRNVWKLCLEAARNSKPGEPFGISEISSWAGQPFGDALARLRVLGRPEKRLGIKVFVKIDGSAPTEYELLDEVRAAILHVG